VIALNFCLNFLFSGTTDSLGFAWGTALSLSLGAVALAAFFFRGSPCWKDGLPRMYKAVVSAAAMGAALHFLSPLFLSLQDARLLLVAKCVLLGAGGLALYLLLCALLGERGLWNDIRGRVGKK
jgi:Na+-driven multidrug efflux pump